MANTLLRAMSRVQQTTFIARPRAILASAQSTFCFGEIHCLLENLVLQSFAAECVFGCLIRRMASRMLWGGLFVLALLGFEALPHVLLRSLENRYPVHSSQEIDRHAGVIVLGGAIEHPAIFEAHAQVPLGQAAERMTVPVGLLRQSPQLALVFSGGEGRLLTTGVSEAEMAKVLYEQQVWT